jgi:hypothetical protein
MGRVWIRARALPGLGETDTLSLNEGREHEMHRIGAGCFIPI